MARIRSIKPEFWASEQVMECSPIARLLFIGLWNFCDDGGNHVDSDRTIKAEIFPGDDISSEGVRRLLDELSSNGLIALYSSNGKGFIHVTGWQHQKIDRPSFKHPPFPGDDSQNVRRKVVEDSPPEGKGREGRGGEEATPNPSAVAEGNPSGRRKREKITFDAFVQTCHEAGEKAVPSDDPIFQFAADTGIAKEFLHLAWREFAGKHRGTQRLQKDWRAHFRDAVRRNWFKLWWFPSEGACELTTAGVQLKREHEAERQRQLQNSEAAA